MTTKLTPALRAVKALTFDVFGRMVCIRPKNTVALPASGEGNIPAAGAVETPVTPHTIGSSPEQRRVNLLHWFCHGK